MFVGIKFDIHLHAPIHLNMEAGAIQVSLDPRYTFVIAALSSLNYKAFNICYLL